MTSRPSEAIDAAAEQSAMLRAADALRQPIQRLLKLNNALIFVVFLVGLGAVTYVRTTHIYPSPPSFLGWLTLLRIVLPIAALALTALTTQRAMQRCARAAGDEPVRALGVLPAFVSCKRVSMLASGVAGLAAAGCLVFGHRTLDVLLALLPLALLLFTRPNLGALLTFTNLVESLRRELRGEESGRSTTEPGS